MQFNPINTSIYSSLKKSETLQLPIQSGSANPSFYGTKSGILNDTIQTALKNKYKEKLKAAIKNNDVKIIFNAIGIKAKRDIFGKYTVYGYGEAGGARRNLADLGVNENNLFKKIKRIKGIVDLRKSKLTNWGGDRKIDGDIILYPWQLPSPTKYYDTINHNGKLIFKKRQIANPKPKSDLNVDVSHRPFKLGIENNMFSVSIPCNTLYYRHVYDGYRKGCCAHGFGAI